MDMRPVVNVVLAGLGGQGVVKASDILAEAAFRAGLDVKKAEVHGMSQRGGAVQSYLRLSDRPVFSDLIPLGKADLILSVEPMESLRYLPYLSQEGYVVTNTTPYKNIVNYPDIVLVMDTIRKLPRVVAIDAEAIAREIGNSKVSNMVMLGAATPFIDIAIEGLEDGIREIFGRKGELLVNLNLRALYAGREFAEANK